MSEQIYQQLVAAVQPLLKGYQDDLLVHDKRSLVEQYPGVPFLHWTREHGTDLVILHPAESEAWPKAGESVPYLFAMANRVHILNQIVVLAKYELKEDGMESKRTCHYFNGKTLKQITCARAVEVAWELERSVSKYWEAAEKKVRAA